MGYTGKFFNIKDADSGICNGLPKDKAGIGLKGFLDFFLGSLRIDENTLDAQTL